MGIVGFEHVGHTNIQPDQINTALESSIFRGHVTVGY